MNFDIQGANLLPALRNTTFAVGAESGGTRFQDIVQAAAGPQSLDTHLFSAIFGQGRSDYANFLNVDVPSVFFTDSTGPCYHTNQDEPGVVDYGKLDQQIATALATTRELGNTGNPPAWTENDAGRLPGRGHLRRRGRSRGHEHRPLLGAGPADHHEHPGPGWTRSATTVPTSSRATT